MVASSGLNNTIAVLLIMTMIVMGVMPTQFLAMTSAAIQTIM
jgi:hypothetical protein